MKSRIIALSAALLGALLLSAFTLHIDDSKDELLIKLIMRGLGDNHYSTPEVDDDFSKEVFDLYLKRLDYSKRFLTQVDLDKLNKYKYQIDNEINGASYLFFNLSVDILEARIKQAETYYKEILDQPFDFTVDEEYDINSDELAYADDKVALKEQWRKYLKYRTLTRLSDLIEENKKKSDKGEEELKPTEVLEAMAREKVMKGHDDWFRRLRRLDREDRLSTYINAITNVYDPHTGYFPPKDKEDFDIQISGRLEGIGASLSEKDGYVEVQRVIPGSPAYRQGDLEAKDLIIKVAQGEEEAVDVVDMRLDDVVRMIRGKKGTEVRLTVRKIDDSEVEIPIIRDIVILEETYAKSVVLTDDNMDKKIGYIYLPKFYTDFTRTGGRTCSEDVRQEIYKLKKNDIDGLVLDLRNNGGGSLNDVVKMAGLFIETGPIVQIKGRKGRPYVMRDNDPEVQYDGPMVVMVNHWSASASEILAAAMQDYERAIIMGSSSTFGKGTVQRFDNLDRFVSQNMSEIKPLGAMKYTTQKFYRIDGGATQLKGVIPDIILPDNYAFIDVGEKERDHPMEWDEIEPVTYDKWKGLSGKISKVRKNSQKRIKQSPTFQLIAENANRLKKLQDETSYSLDLETFLENEQMEKDQAESYKDIQEEIPSLHITPLPEDVVAMDGDSVKADIAKEWHEKLQKDHYLYEAMQVIGKDL